MQYRSFGKLDWKVSALGFGCMRLPILDNDYSKVNEDEATQMIHLAIDQGVNYLDTAYVYHRGSSEVFLGKALKKGYREKVRLATKLPVHQVKSLADCDRLLNEQLNRLQTDHIDYYLLHGLNAGSWRSMQSLEIIPWAKDAIASGRIHYLGFSFHDKLPAFKEIITATDIWSFCQIQYNYMDINEQAGTEGLKFAAEHGLAVVIMEPLLGGKLANPNATIQALWDTINPRRSPVEWALDWLWNQPEVSVVLSGMSTQQQVTEDLVYADRSRVGCLSVGDLALIENVRSVYEHISPIPCTKCEYCLPCSNGLPIPQIFDIYNNVFKFGDLKGGMRSYAWLPEIERANNCTQCGQCEDLCPQHIAIRDWMITIHKELNGSPESK
jgi:uncharacterized protein